MAKTTISNTEWAKAGFKDFAVEEQISAPFTQILNRAKVSNSLKAAMGIERIIFTSGQQLNNEFGASGEPVYEPTTKDERVRFVGPGWANLTNTSGTRFRASTTTDYAEVTFYGTGLNCLSEIGGVIDVRVTVDGGAEAGSSFIPNASTVLTGRNYMGMAVLTVASGLVAGWHTVKMRHVSGGWGPFGFEILNERSDVLFPSGSAFSGLIKEALNASTSSAYNSSVTGTRGGRVVKYVKNGSIGEVFQPVDASSATLTSANHDNEEVIRRVHWREFGANRNDDLSTLTTTSNRSFTLDDGTTTLSGYQVEHSTELNLGVNGSYWVLTFVGTGLDIVRSDSGNGGADTYNIQVDGGSAISLPSSGSTAVRRTTLVSGLPYGTHTVRVNRVTAATWGLRTHEFIIYGPKKPTVPAGAVELADYCVMADYVISTSGATDSVSSGVLRKNAIREIVYVGTWTVTQDTTNTTSGFYVGSTVAASYAEHTFFGTGVEWIFKTNSGLAHNLTISIDGSSNLSGYTTQYVPASTGTSFSAATGTITGTSAGQGHAQVSIRGLPLGVHKIRITQNTTTNTVTNEAFDIITPIHSHGDGLFKVGSLSLKDTRNELPTPLNPIKGVDLSKAKAWAVIDQVNSRVLASYNVSAVINPSTGQSRIHFTRPFKTANYVISAMSDQNGDVLVSTGITTTADHAQLIVVNSSHLVVNGMLYAVFFGELQDEELT